MDNWGFKWTEVSAMSENKDMGLLPGATRAMCPHSAIPTFHSHLRLFLSVFLGCVYSRLLPLLSGRLVCRGQHEALCLVTEVAMWPTAFLGRYPWILPVMFTSWRYHWLLGAHLLFLFLPPNCFKLQDYSDAPERKHDYQFRVFDCFRLCSSPLKPEAIKV